MPKQPKEIIKVNVAECERIEWQPRQYFKEDDLRGLGESMLHGRQYDPIVVTPKKGVKDGVCWRIVSGERRFRAAQLVGLETLDAEVRRYKSDDAIFEDMCGTNSGAEALTVIEEANACDRLMQAECVKGKRRTVKLAYAARVFSKNPQWVESRLKLVNLEPTVQKMLEPSEDARRPPLQLKVAEGLSEITDPDTQVAFARRMVSSGMPAWRAERMLADHHEKEGRAPSKPTAGRAKRSDYVRLLTTFVLGVANGVDKILVHGEDGFKEMLAKLTPADVTDFVLKLEEAAGKLQGLLDLAKEAQKQAKRAAKGNGKTNGESLSVN